MQQICLNKEMFLWRVALKISKFNLFYSAMFLHGEQHCVFYTEVFFEKGKENFGKPLIFCLMDLQPR